jgi:hypothetical protein
MFSDNSNKSLERMKEEALREMIKKVERDSSETERSRKKSKKKKNRKRSESKKHSITRRKSSSHSR